MKVINKGISIWTDLYVAFAFPRKASEKPKVKMWVSRIFRPTRKPAIKNKISCIFLFECHSNFCKCNFFLFLFFIFFRFRLRSFFFFYLGFEQQKQIGCRLLTSKLCLDFICQGPSFLKKKKIYSFSISLSSLSIFSSIFSSLIPSANSLNNLNLK